MYDPSRDWSPTFIDPDSGGDPINIHCECGLEFCTGTYDWGEFVKAWNRRANDGKIDADAFERSVMFGDAEDMQDVIYALREFPTAYDPDKVVEQLEDRKSLMLETLKISEADIDRGRIYGMDKAIEIVKGGGVDEMEE